MEDSFTENSSREPDVQLAWMPIKAAPRINGQGLIFNAGDDFFANHERSHVTSLNIGASNDRLNAILGLVLLVVLGLAVVENIILSQWLWGSFTLVCLLVALIPPSAAGDWEVMAPWPLLLSVTIGLLAGGNGIYSEVAGYIAVAGLGVLLAIELDVFTSVEMSRRFALGFAVLTTLAVQGLWTIGQYYSDLWFETSFLTTQRELQIDIVIVTLVGVTTGVLFEWYFARVSPNGSQLHPNEPSNSR